METYNFKWNLYYADDVSPNTVKLAIEEIPKIIEKLKRHVHGIDNCVV